jgi:DNA-binding NarL/FixJ family response regulator
LTPNAELRVSVVEEHEIVRRGLIACLSEDGSLKVSAAAPEELAANGVDVAVVSEDAAASHSFLCPIVVCSACPAALPRVAPDNEVAGVLDRGAVTAAQLHATVHAAAAGLRVNPQMGDGAGAKLDSRAVLVLELIADGHSTREIADRMSYSERTIKKLITGVEATMHARSRAQVVALAIRRGLI